MKTLISIILLYADNSSCFFIRQNEKKLIFATVLKLKIMF